MDYLFIVIVLNKYSRREFMHSFITFYWKFKLQEANNKMYQILLSSAVEFMSRSKLGMLYINDFNQFKISSCNMILTNTVLTKEAIRPIDVRDVLEVNNPVNRTTGATCYVFQSSAPQPPE